MKRADKPIRLQPVAAMLLSGLLSGASMASAGDEIFDARGFNRSRSFFSQLPYEHIDPLTGDLLLTFTDLVLPGNAGFDLRIQRTYNSKIYRDYMSQNLTLDEDSWAGVGWILHLGRVMNPNALGVPPGPIEMPDGSRHKLYNRGTNPDGFGLFITKDFWVYSKSTNPPTLRLTNGLLYTFGYQTSVSGQSWAYVTEIRDPFDNTITVNYGVTGAPDGITTITQNLGTRSRTLTFASNSISRGELDSMTFTGSQTSTWTYTQEANPVGAGFNRLKGVAPPTGPGWTYGYDDVTSELKKLTTPNGGTIDYKYAEKSFHHGTTVLVRSRAVTQRDTSGRSITEGTWKYDYAMGSLENQSIITTMQGATTIRKETWTFNGVGQYSTAVNVWKIGLPGSRVLEVGTTKLESEDFIWGAGNALPQISSDTETVGTNQDVGIRAPQLSTRTIKRPGSTGTEYKTTHTYSASNFADYGRPSNTVETGTLGMRTTDRTFWYGAAATRYIKDRTSSETVTVGAESFARSWQYEPADGFLKQETVYGITTDFTPAARGNTATEKNANLHTTTYAYDWGVLSATTPPVADTATTRVINAEGTIASETRRGFTTNFEYDKLFRPTKRTPPAVANLTTWTYNNPNNGPHISTTVVRGPSSTTTTLDGFGRPTATANTVGVETSTTYDALGRKTYVSYPHKPPTYPNRGTSYEFDGLDRVTKKTNPDTFFATFDYSTTDGIDVTITDEMNHVTIQNCSAFGDPREARLISVTDPRAKVTSYSYNAVGSLTGVTPPPGFPARSWHYNTKNLLDTETHPESGAVTYTYYAAGNVYTKVDPAFGTTTYTYDGNERLTNIDRPGTPHDTDIGYDGSDNRTSLRNGYVDSTFFFDAANRLTQRRDIVNGQTFNTSTRQTEMTTLDESTIRRETQSSTRTTARTA